MTARCASELHDIYHRRKVNRNYDYGKLFSKTSYQISLIFRIKSISFCVLMVLKYEIIGNILPTSTRTDGGSLAAKLDSVESMCIHQQDLMHIRDISATPESVLIP